jgi:hypothetical protein
MTQQYVVYVARFLVQILSSAISYTILTLRIFYRKGGWKEELNIYVISWDTLSVDTLCLYTIWRYE